VGPAALRASLSGIDVPSSVRNLDESPFEACEELECCLMGKDSSLVKIGEIIGEVNFAEVI
jgi:hypothetical protein